MGIRPYKRQVGIDWTDKAGTFVVLAYDKAGTLLRQDEVTGMEAVTEHIYDVAGYSRMVGGKFEVVWDGHIVSTAEVVW